MEILWPALGIGAIVIFVLYVLASQWQRTLRQQSWLVRRLADRVQVLEELGDPQFRRLLGESSPVPLERVITLSFHLNEKFWRDILRLSEEDRNYVRTFGSFVGSVKLECWRSHMVALITEVLPESKRARWQTRSLDFYPDPARDKGALTLRDLFLERPNGSSAKPSSLDLILTNNAVELHGNLTSAHSKRVATIDLRESGGECGGQSHEKTVTLFRIPLDSARLATFRSHDLADVPANGNGNRNGTSAEEPQVTSLDAGAWEAFYSDRDESLGIEWQLRLRDLTKKAEWERWRVLESTAVRNQIDET